MRLNKYILHQIAFKLYNQVKKKKRASYALGVSSIVNRKYNLHIPMLDYDNKTLEEVVLDLWKLTNKFKLKTAYVYQTRMGFHALFPFDMMGWDEVKKVIKSARVDWRFKSFCDEYGRVYLRVSGKYKDHDIKFVGVTKSPYRPTHEEAEIGNGILQMHEELFKTHDKIFYDKKVLYE